MMLKDSALGELDEKKKYQAMWTIV